MYYTPHRQRLQNRHPRRPLKIALWLVFIVVVWILIARAGGDEDQQDTTNQATTNSNQTIETTSNTNEATNTNATASELPEKFSLDVPFTSQAPDANWDQPYQDACEEASAITVHFFYEGNTFTPAIADAEILKFVDFENEFLGFYKDTTAAELASVIREYWGYERVDVIDNPSVQTIKEHIAAGRPVIVPAAGRRLGNPNFSGEGPLYHMLVIRGYDKSHFFTNDVGTRKGENYRYDIDTIMDSMHDWNGGEVDSGTPRIVVIYPKSAISSQ